MDAYSNLGSCSLRFRKDKDVSFDLNKARLFTSMLVVDKDEAMTNALYRPLEIAVNDLVEACDEIQAARERLGPAGWRMVKEAVESRREIARLTEALKKIASYKLKYRPDDPKDRDWNMVMAIANDAINPTEAVT